MSYHYKESGLPNVWLVNGFVRTKTPYGDAIKIRNVLGLHKAIAQAMCKNPKPLTGAEFRFLRKEMELSQKRLAELMGTNEQRIARWEKGQTDVDLIADRLLRGIYLDCADGNHGMRDLVNRLNEAGAYEYDTIRLKFDHDKWRPAA